MERMLRSRSSLAIVVGLILCVSFNCRFNNQIEPTNYDVNYVQATSPTDITAIATPESTINIPTPIATSRPIGTPVTILLGIESTPETYYSKIEKTERPNLMTRSEFMSAMALTSWRSYIINDPAFSTLLWEMVKCESGSVDEMVRTQEIGDQDIGYTSIGVFQINIDVWPHLAKQYNLFIPDENMQAAFEIWQSPKGLDNWSCYPIVREYFD